MSMPGSMRKGDETDIRIAILHWITCSNHPSLAMLTPRPKNHPVHHEHPNVIMEFARATVSNNLSHLWVKAQRGIYSSSLTLGPTAYSSVCHTWSINIDPILIADPLSQPTSVSTRILAFLHRLRVTLTITEQQVPRLAVKHSSKFWE